MKSFLLAASIFSYTSAIAAEQPSQSPTDVGESGFATQTLRARIVGVPGGSIKGCDITLRNDGVWDIQNCQGDGVSLIPEDDRQ